MPGGFPAFCQSNLPLIYGLYGLAFFVTGIVVALESGRTSQLELRHALPYLAGFGILHGIHEWIEMLLLMTPDLGVSPQLVQAVSVTLLATSFVLLIQFATLLMASLEPQYASLTRLTIMLTALYLVGLVYYRVRFFDGDEFGFWRFADILARYLLGVPGAVLASAAMFVQRRAFIRQGYAQFSRDLIGAALAFAWYAAFQFIVPPAQFLPAALVNTDTFQAYTSIPVQLFRAIVGALAAFFIVRVLRVFETEYAQRIERLNRERFQAQEQAARELTVLFETCRILGTSLNLGVLLNEAIEKIVTLVEPVVAGTIFLCEPNALTLVPRATYRRSGVELPPDLPERALQLARRACDTHDLVYEPANQEVAVLALPLLSTNQVLGAIGLAHAGAFSNLAVLQTLARQLVIAIENARLYEQVQEKQELRGELLERVVAAQEDERKRLARELHDQTGQTLAGLAMGLHSVNDLMQSNPQLAGKRVRELEVLSAGAVEDLRSMIDDLRPAQLDDLGLVPALREMAEQVAARSGMQVRLNPSEPRRRLEPVVETTLYRLAQEALNNAARHSHATRATITLKFSARDVTLDIRDDGVGFVPSAVVSPQAPRRAWGLLGMQERVRLVGGSLDIRSAPGKGTRLTAQIPIETLVPEPSAPVGAFS